MCRSFFSILQISKKPKKVDEEFNFVKITFLFLLYLTFLSDKYSTSNLLKSIELINLLIVVSTPPMLGYGLKKIFYIYLASLFILSSMNTQIRLIFIIKNTSILIN